MNDVVAKLTKHGFTLTEADMIDDIIKSVRDEKLPDPTPAPADVKVGDRVSIHGWSRNAGRTGTVVEMPGPSKKYGGRDAERIEVRLDTTSHPETIWVDNNDNTWLEILKA